MHLHRHYTTSNAAPAGSERQRLPHKPRICAQQDILPDLVILLITPGQTCLCSHFLDLLQGLDSSLGTELVLGRAARLRASCWTTMPGAEGGICGCPPARTCTWMPSGTCATSAATSTSSTTARLWTRSRRWSGCPRTSRRACFSCAFCSTCWL